MNSRRICAAVRVAFGVVVRDMGTGQVYILSSMAGRRPFVGGNWKMNTDLASAVELADNVTAGCDKRFKRIVKAGIVLVESTHHRPPA